MSGPASRRSCQARRQSASSRSWRGAGGRRRSAGRTKCCARCSATAISYLWVDGKLLGIDWSVWKVIGWTGNLVFFSRFFVQWYATEKRRRVVVPTAFWWLSLTGSLLLLIYSLRQRDSVFIFAYLFTWIPYIRNLVIHRRHEEAHRDCHRCGASCAPQWRFCAACGVPLMPSTVQSTSSPIPHA
ncbi:MAG: lipid-A-disaccharide synthase N-terminal domain-containing protein [Candidatus Rokubacteria bacterium]|nr:lipid-A-disaccharide synthase N-terminal domain-containing protein [Candidatus Rokubacteria bacterium]